MSKSKRRRRHGLVHATIYAPRARDRVLRPSARPGRLERLADDGERLLDVRRASTFSGRRDAEDVAVEAALADQEAALPGLLEDAVRQRLRSGVRSPMVSSTTSSIACIRPMPRTSPIVSRVAALQLLEAVAQERAPIRSALPAQVLLLDDVDRRVGRGARDRVAAEGRDRQRLERRRRSPASRCMAPSGSPFAMPLAIVMMSGSTPVVLDAPELAAGAAEARSAPRRR